MKRIYTVLNKVSSLPALILAVCLFVSFIVYFLPMQKAGTVNDAVKIRDAMDGLEFEDPNNYQQVLPTHRFKRYYSMSVYHESSTGMDNFEILALSTNTDLWQKEWEHTIINPYPSFPEIRDIRGY